MASRKSSGSDELKGQGAHKKPKQESTSNEEQCWLFSVTQCSFGEDCQFLHVVHGGNKDNPMITFSVTKQFARDISGKDGRTCMVLSTMSQTNITINDHESDDQLKNVEVQGPPINLELCMELLGQHSYSVNKQLPETCPGSIYKTELCKHFLRGSCLFGDKCNLAHGATELRKDRRVFK